MSSVGLRCCSFCLTVNFPLHQKIYGGVTFCYSGFQKLFSILDIDVLFFLICKQVKVNTVLGSNAPSLTVKLVRASRSGLKDGSAIESQVSYLPSFSYLSCPSSTSAVLFQQFYMVNCFWLNVFLFMWCRISNLTKRVNPISWICQRLLMLGNSCLFSRYPCPEIFFVLQQCI